jgi:hypothetical protein
MGFRPGTFPRPRQMTSCVHIQLGFPIKLVGRFGNIAPNLFYIAGACRAYLVIQLNAGAAAQRLLSLPVPRCLARTQVKHIVAAKALLFGQFKGGNVRFPKSTTWI